MDRIFVTITLLMLFTTVSTSWMPRSLNAQEKKSEEKKSEEKKSELGFNLKLKTLGGQQFWTDVVYVGGWKLQRNEMDKHFRLIDPKSYRHAWGSYEGCKNVLDRKIAEGEATQIKGEVVILLHGLMRSRRSLNKLAKYLQVEGGFKVIPFEYASSRADIASHAKALHSVLEGLGPDVTKIHFVGHSLGNIVVRHLLGDIKNDDDGSKLNARFGRMVMMGPPNQGSRMARVLKNSLTFTALSGVSGVQLSTTWGLVEPQLATPEFDFGIIAGGQENSRWSNFVLKGPDDYSVSLDETKLVGARDLMVKPLVHSTMMNQPEVIEATLKFLKTGYFVSEESRQPITSLKDQ